MPNKLFSFSIIFIFEVIYLFLLHNLNNIAMCTVTMTFDIPETRKIDIESLKKEIYDFFNMLISRDDKVSKTARKSWTEDLLS